MSLVFVPIYIKFIGIEAYGLIGIFLSLQALFSLLDLGLSTTLNRELARMSSHIENPRTMRDLVRTLELVYWALAISIGIAVALLAPVVAYYWVNAEQLTPETIYHAILLMGLVIAFQLPFSLYSGGLLGLQRQVLLNGIIVIMATLRGVGAVLVLWLIDPSIQAFFLWQIIVSVLQTTVTMYFLWSNLPESARGAQFKSRLLIDIWRFAAGMTGVSVLSVILMQMDKIILSRILSLEMFGYYTLASVAAGGLYIMFGPMFFALFPRFSQMVAQNDVEGQKRLYHNGSQLMSVMILPVAVVVALFSKEVLFLWTGDPVIVERAHLILSFLIIGTALGGLMNLPFAMQLAHGWTKLAFYQNLIALVVLIPMLIWLAKNYGAEGAASIWILLNAGYVLGGIQYMHTRLLREEKARWYFHDVLKPLSITLLIALPAYWYFPQNMSVLLTLVGIILITAMTFLVTALQTPYTRAVIMQVLKARRTAVVDP